MSLYIEIYRDKNLTGLGANFLNLDSQRLTNFPLTGKMRNSITS